LTEEQEERINIFMVVVALISLYASTRLILYVLEYFRVNLDAWLMVGAVLLIVDGTHMTRHIDVLVDFIKQRLKTMVPLKEENEKP